MRKPSPDADQVVDKFAEQAKLDPNDPEPWEELYVLLWDPLYRIALSVCLDHGHAEEAVQEGFSAAWRSIWRWDESRGHFRPWIGVIVFRKAVDQLRRRQEPPVDVETEGTVIPLLTVDHTTTAEFHQVEHREVIRGFLEEITDERHRGSIYLRYFGGLTSEEIGEYFGVSGSAVRGWIRAVEQRWDERRRRRDLSGWQ